MFDRSVDAGGDQAEPRDMARSAPCFMSRTTSPATTLDRAASLTLAPDDCQRGRLSKGASVGWQGARASHPDRSTSSGGVLTAVAHFHVSDLHVFLAIWPAWLRRYVAEVELSGTRLADRPAAGDHTSIRSRRRRNRPGWWYGNRTGSVHHRPWH